MTATRRGVARAGALAFVAALAACGGSSTGVKQTPRGAVEVGSFVGQVNLVTGEMTIAPTGIDPVPMGLVFRGALEEIPVQQNQIWGDVGEGAVEMRTVSGTMQTYPGGCYDPTVASSHTTSFEADIAIHSGFASTRLVRPYVEITYLSETGFESCQSAPPPPDSSLSAANGLYQYPDIEPNGVSTATWNFKLGTAAYFTFHGRVWAERVDTAAPATTASLAFGDYAAPQVLSLSCGDGSGSNTGCADTFYTVGGGSATPYNRPLHLSGTQSICYWSVDLRGNEELPHHCGTFHVTSAPADAEYDATTTHVPRCFGIASACDTNTLIVGRGTMGAGEPHQPNTLDACAEGSLGTYGTSDSLDRMVLSTDDNGPLAPGRPVTLTATVTSSAAGERLQVFTATSTSSPSWVQAGSTQVTSGTGAQTLAVSFTLPAGAVAVRARFGPTPSSSCVTGSLDDQDDLVFTPDVATIGGVAPSVTLSAPAASSNVAGGVLVKATVPADVEADHVEVFWRDPGYPPDVPPSDWVSLDIDRSPPWLWAWDALTAVVGTNVEFYAVVTDTSGRTATSATVSASVVELPPTVSVQNPSEAAEYNVGDTVSVTIHATKDHNVSQIDLYVDGGLVGSDTSHTGPDVTATLDWNTGTNGFSAGRHTIFARAWDYMTHQSQSFPVHVTLR